MLSLGLSLLLGASLGAALGYFGKCSSGMCPLTANPWRGALVGSVFGLLLYMSAGQRGGAGATATPNVKQISEAEFEAEVLQSALPVVVDFYATWCGPCKTLAPRLNEVAGQFEGKVKVVKVDVDKSPQLAGRYQVQGVPTLLMFRKGAVADKAVGLLTKGDLRSRLEVLANQAEAR
jgi:thioredoxin 1